MKTIAPFIFSIVLMLFLYSCSSTRRIKEGEYLLSRNVILSKGIKIEKTDFEPYIKIKPNRKVLDIFPFYLHIYNLVDADKVKQKRLIKNQNIDIENVKRASEGKKLKSKDKFTFREWLLDIGEPPVLVDSFLISNSSRQLELFLNNKGYFKSTVSDSILYKNKRAIVFYKVKSTKPYTIRNVVYDIEDQQLANYTFIDTSKSFLKKGDRYDTDLIQRERDRITNELLNYGYYYFSKEYIYFQVDSSLNNNQVDITVGIKKYSQIVSGQKDSVIETNHQRYNIGKVYIQTDFMPKVSDKLRKDTIIENGYYFIYHRIPQFKPEAVLFALFLKEGDLYQLKNVDRTYKRISEFKEFKIIDIYFTSSGNVVDAHINLTPVTKQSVALEAEGRNTSGNLGIIGSLVYQNKNTFKGMELLEIRLRGGIEAQQLANISNDNSNNLNIKDGIPFNTIEIGPEGNLSFPRFLLPFRVKSFISTAPKTILSSAFNYQLRPDYTRWIANFSFGYSWKETPQKQHTINPFEINLVKVNTRGAFKTFIESSNDLLIRNSFTDHVAFSSRYIFQYNDQNLNKKNNNFSFFKFSAESSGNLLHGVNELLKSPKDENGSYRIINIIYSQYLRFDADYRFYKVFTGQNKAVFRTYLGYGHPLKNLNVLPFEKSFFAGGSNGLRAWRARSLGPGSFKNSSNRFDQIGDIQLEGNLEGRFKIFKMLNGALFVDAGNIWLGSPDVNRPRGDFNFKKFYKELAIGSGVGARVDFGFFVARLDVALKMRDPQFGDDENWVIKKVFNKNWKNDFQVKYGDAYSFLNFNLGIGYPF